MMHLPPVLEGPCSYRSFTGRAGGAAGCFGFRTGSARDGPKLRPTGTTTGLPLCVGLKGRGSASAGLRAGRERTFPESSETGDLNTPRGARGAPCFSFARCFLSAPPPSASRGSQKTAPCLGPQGSREGFPMNVAASPRRIERCRPLASIGGSRDGRPKAVRALRGDYFGARLTPFSAATWSESIGR